MRASIHLIGKICSSFSTSMHATTSPVFVLLHIAICTTFVLTGSDGRTCLPAERDALLDFKKGITRDPLNLLSSWHGRDCCRWRGVRCSNESGHVLKLSIRNPNPYSDPNYSCEDGNAISSSEISPSLLSLEQLEHLDLSSNCFTGHVPSFLGSMKKLRYLNLSGLAFSGEVPPQLGNLSNLQYLDLGSSPYFKNYIYTADITWLKNLPMLQHLSMSFINLSRISDWPHVLNSIPTLKVIDLSCCSLDSANQSIPYPNLTKLEMLDLLGNSFHSEITSCWFWNVTSLRYLYLSENRLLGQFHDALENMALLQVLDLSYNEGINMVMKGNSKNLCSLEILYLSGIGMNGDIAVLIEWLSHCASNVLKELHLDYNKLIGDLPNLIGHFTSLTLLDLSNNALTGSIPPKLANCSSLVTLDLSENQLSGTIPVELGAYANLTSLVLSNNYFTGVITEEHFVGLTSLTQIDLSSNSLTVVIDKHWRAPFSLNFAQFKSCQMGPLFPAWLQQQLEITRIDISESGLMGKIPDWFWATFSQAKYIDISSNRFTGPIPLLPKNISYLDISNNSFSGTLPSDFEVQELDSLFMNSNKLGGTIPESLCKLETLIDLDLSNNHFEGEIPPCVETKFGQDIQYFLLSNNSFTGAFPTFLHKSKDLQFLSLAMNKFVGSIPPWIGNMSNLQFLKLSHNSFSGSIPDKITNLSQLRYLDLSDNNLSGIIPRVSGLTSMTLKNYLSFHEKVGHLMPDAIGFFGETISTVTKGQQLRYGSGLEDFVSIDLSGNSLTGEIPSGITYLDALMNLNLSSNFLCGNIPDKIGTMRLLASLDLSKNKLSDEIPSSISNLTSLSFMNLSYNNLSGRIPSGRQLDTISADNPSLMYIGNSGLCGPPLQNGCSGKDDVVHGDQMSRQELDPMSFYFGLVLGLVAGLWVVFCTLLFKKTWRIYYFQFIDKLYDKIYVFVVVKWMVFSRKQDAE